MWDEEQDREMMRRQMSAIFLIGFILLGWMMFFSPQQPVVEPPVQAPGDRRRPVGRAR